MSQIKGKAVILANLQNIYDEHVRLLDFLLKDEEDVNTFKKEYMYSNMEDVAKINDFRILQRFRKSITKGYFLQKYNYNKKEALETLFQEPLSSNDIQIFVQQDKPLGEVYQLSTDNISIRLLSLLELWDFVKNKEKPSSFDDFL